MRLLLSALLFLTACNREEQPAPPTAEESERLDDAESMLNGLANEEGPEDLSSGPSNHSD